ncbi:NAD(P)/FAD-dependent oxidoreductase [Paenibacillus sp. OV219]|uniref:NAD(P)/FAD-dependent oxidoreductase n=1 Tax=Paenibacillus sp. OV219 TaxID=1884377 RepID=UPI0008ACF804|nr:NAD(P)/FAD-dependent oxidoreductase [Paenibacillus sp. OV219]SEM63159.1 Thioredoxin reductase [Paenibacillus sp. OV219]
MLLDCIIIGGGPAGLNAALVLGRARRNVILFDDNKPRNAVTRQTSGFITRDGIAPTEFRQLAHQDLRKYPTVLVSPSKVTAVRHINGVYQATSEQGYNFVARSVILATGLRETLPAVRGIHDYYGKSLFSCPYCDGWELRDKPLVLIADHESAFYLAKKVYNWSKDLVFCTNGLPLLSPHQKDRLRQRGIAVIESKIAALIGAGGMLQQVQFEDGLSIERAGGFVTPQWTHASQIIDMLACRTNEMGIVVKDHYGRTSVPGVYVAGDTSFQPPAQVIVAAAEGCKAAIAVNTDLVEADF